MPVYSEGIVLHIICCYFLIRDDHVLIISVMSNMFVWHGANPTQMWSNEWCLPSVPSGGLQGDADSSGGEGGEKGEASQAQTASQLSSPLSVWCGKCPMSARAFCHMMNHVTSGCSRQME